MIGKTISHYKILEKLGEGGMGVVYKAEDTKLKRTVALKFLPFELTRDPQAKTRFIQEARAASALNHTNICVIYEIDELEDQSFIAMEYVEGRTLGRLLKERELSLSEALDVVIQITEGLNAAHKKGIVHRDIKPDNVMVTDENLVKIMDFGLAKLKGSSTLTKEHSTLGTLSYMSPEQVQGIEADQRSDIFSVGVVLYEMVTGRRPFRGEHEAAIIYSLLNEIPEPLARYKAGVPDELQVVIDRVLVKDREARYQHVGEMMSDLRSVKRQLEVVSASAEHREPATSAAAVSPEPATQEQRGAMTREPRGLAVREPRGTVATAACEPAREPAKPRWSKKRQLYLFGGLAVLIVLLVLGKICFFSPARGPIDSIAVLPLQNLSGDPNQEYFSDGMTEALITELQKIRSLRVISRTSVMRYKKTQKLLPEIARELNVKAVVEGSVSREGDNVRVNVQLMQAFPEKHLWADNFDRNMKSILALQSDVAQAIAREVKIVVTPEEQERMASSRSVNPEAHDAYLKGRFYWNKRTAPDIQKAIDYFNQAIKKDPNYALAYAGLAVAYATLPSYAGVPPKEMMSKAEGAARRALELDPTLGEAHVVLAVIKSDFEWDWAGAEREYKRAIELDPSNPTAHQWYGQALSEVGRLDEGVAEITRAQELDPLSLVISSVAGDALYYMRRYDEAIVQYKKTLELDPGFALARVALGDVYEVQGRFDEAIAEFQKARELLGSGPFGLPDLGCAYARSGNKGEAVRVLNELSGFLGQGYSVSAGIGMVYYGLGDTKKAFYWLEKGLDERNMPLDLKVSPVWDGLRSDPRFTALLKKMGLEK